MDANAESWTWDDDLSNSPSDANPDVYDTHPQSGEYHPELFSVPAAPEASTTPSSSGMLNQANANNDLSWDDDGMSEQPMSGMLCEADSHLSWDDEGLAVPYKTTML